MLITVDIGNTDIVTVLFDENKHIVKQDRINLKSVLVNNNLDYFDYLFVEWNLKNINYIVACVVPDILKSVEDKFLELSNARGIILESHMLPNFTNDKSEVGTDLIAVSFPFRKEAIPTVVVDMGSASKIILVLDGQLKSVAIMLGVQNTMLALASRIKHLPEVKLEFPDELLGETTVTAIQAGLMYSQAYGIRGYVDEIEQSLKQPIKRILTGGIGAIFKDKLTEFTYEPTLLNDGLYAIYQEVIQND